jgi:hypothetical protein
MAESRLGLGRKSARLRCWCDEGRIKADKARFTRSPSTPPILTSEFVIADLRAFSLFCEYGAEEDEECEPNPLCKLHRNEPGWFVGEHIQVLFWVVRFTIWLPPAAPRGETEMERLGEIERWWSSVNRTEVADGEDPYMLTRGGEAERWWLLKKVLDLEEKLDVEEAKAEEDEYGDGEWPPQNLPEGERDRRIGPLEVLLEETAIFCWRRRRENF